MSRGRRPCRAGRPRDRTQARAPIGRGDHDLRLDGNARSRTSPRPRSCTRRRSPPRSGCGWPWGSVDPSRLALLVMVAVTAHCEVAMAEPTTAHRVVFVCEHGNVKSLIASQWFNRLAAERGLAVRAVSRGVVPEEGVPAPIADQLRNEGFDVRAFGPLALERDDLGGALRLVMIGPDAPAWVSRVPVPVETLGRYSAGERATRRHAMRCGSGSRRCWTCFEARRARSVTTRETIGGDAAPRRAPSRTSCRYFLWLGTTGFGGPIALVGFMQRDLVEERRWFSRRGIPRGPGAGAARAGAAGRAARHVPRLGARRRGRARPWSGLAFVLPSFVMVLALAVGVPSTSAGCRGCRGRSTGSAPPSSRSSPAAPSS